MAQTYTAVYKKVRGWYIGYVEELPGANTQGRTLKEVRDNLREAVGLILQANRELLEKEIRGKRVIREKIAVAVE
jgi:predicted RNase H-like HicB family nuclease